MSRPPRPVPPSLPAHDPQALREALPRLVEALSDAVVVLDREGRVVAANARFREGLGASAEALAGRACPRLGTCHYAGAPGEPCPACQMADDPRPRRALQVVQDAAGEKRRWEGTLNPILDEEGRLSLVVEVWRDVTERTQLETQLAHSERLASLGLLAAGVAHELNNPLASVLAGVESLQRWLERARPTGPDAAEAEEVLGVLERETRRCRETTDKLLLLGHAPATRASWVDLNRAVLDTLALLRYAASRQDVDTATELAPDLPLVWGREGALRGVLMNLCLNAVQALAAGGRLVVRTRAAGDRVVLEVEDDGPGIAPEHLPRIWDPFFTTKPVGHGTGLGLSISQRVVTRHGGAIGVDSVPGHGARFTITLPTNGNGGEGV